MREIVLGTAGHVDHGKTSLVRALTGIDTDRLKEEKRRGITIELGFAFLDLPCGRRLGIVDVPGHERFVRNMVAGAAGMDMVAFIIAADEGIMPQSREHLEICRLLGVGQGIVVITKKDSVDSDWLDMVVEEVRDFVAGSFLEGSPIIPVSSLTGDGIDTLVSALDHLVRNGNYPDPYGPFRMPVDRIFSMKGFGSVVTGTSISGSIRIGEEIMLYPDQVCGRIRGIQVHGSEVETVGAGRRTAINVQGLEKEMIHRGDMAASPGCLEPAYVFDAQLLYLAGNKKTLRHRSRVRIHLGTAEIMGRIALVERDEMQPGDEAFVQLLLESPAVAWPGDHFVVRSYSPVTTIGGGVIYNFTARKRKRALESDRGKNREIFTRFHRGDQEEKALLLLDEAGPVGLDFDRMAVKIGIFGNRLKKILERPVSIKKIIIVESDRQRMLAAAVHDQLRDSIRKALAVFHAAQPLQPGMPTEGLRSSLSGRIDPKLFQHLLQSLVRDGSIVQQEAIVRLADHRVTFKEDEQKLRDRLTALYCEAKATPPTSREAEEKMSPTAPAAVRDMIGVLVREGVLVRVSEHLYFAAAFLLDLQERMVKIMRAEGELSPTRFKEITGTSRKFTIPLLEYFDAVKVTMRIGEKRVLRKT